MRMPEGCRKYCPKTGQELYGLLKKNLYGSPLAPKNWAKCRDQFMRELNQRDGWTVKQINYAPCMWSIDIDNGGTTERTYVLIHTDDIDGITRNPAHGVAIKDAFDKRFGVKVKLWIPGSCWATSASCTR